MDYESETSSNKEHSPKNIAENTIQIALGLGFVAIMLVTVFELRTISIPNFGELSIGYLLPKWWIGLSAFGAIVTMVISSVVKRYI